MSLMISRAEGVTVYTVQSNPKSKWPLICQILGTMCYSPVCSVSLRLKQQIGCTFTTLATIQIMVGIINLGFGFLNIATYGIGDLGPVPFWLGGMFLGVGIMCILAEKFPSPCLVVLTVVMNIVSGALAITAIVLYSVSLAQIRYIYGCELPKREPEYQYYWTTASPSKKAQLDEIFEIKLENYRRCEQNKRLIQTICGGLDIMMIVLAVLQLCVTISWCVLNTKALCKKNTDRQDMEDPELFKPLMEQETPNPVC
ncbi:uncharacterized protein tmem176l.1 [Ictalurus furcatus]|uniref:uncharacterized protein tmem176l.1 n=1 Tax=Ictalurus furcatus TaxID=66913 RepID=UPI00234FFD38|nr:uncharacterized protein tmem176l.1 [Ictalurus furcatus]XP_053467976.1 uncharacterized protein tmem176l.1 [Ictalurus furcatus]